MNSVLRDKKAIALFILPPLLLYISLVFVPIVWSFTYSLYQGMPGAEFKFIGFRNYVDMWSNEHFTNGFIMNIRYVACVAMGQVGFGLIIAILIHFSIKRFKSISRTIVFMPVVLPAVATGQMFSKIFEITPQYGLVNALLDFAGLKQLVQPWLGQSSTAFMVLCLMDIWIAMGFHAMIIYGSLSDIPDTTIEASRIDGANSIKVFWHIVLPYLRPVIMTCIIFSLSGTLKMFESAKALTNGGPGTATTPLSMVMYDEAFNFSQYGFGSAIAIFILFECLVATTVVRLINRRFDD